MEKRNTQRIHLCLLLVAITAAESLAGNSSFPKNWVRTGDLGPKPARTTDALPLSDQDNEGKWTRYEPMWDEFDGADLNSDKWYPTNPRWLGRQPALFYPGNVKVSDGKLHLTMRKQEVRKCRKCPKIKAITLTLPPLYRAKPWSDTGISRSDAGP